MEAEATTTETKATGDEKIDEVDGDQTMELPSVNGSTRLTLLKTAEFEIRLESTDDSLNLSVKDKSSLQVFSNIFTEDSLQKMNLHQPVSNVVEMIKAASENCDNGQKSTNNNSSSSSNNNMNNTLSLTFGYFDKQGELPRNGFNNQFVDKSKLSKKYKKDDCLLMIVCMNQAFFQVDYCFRLGAKARTENEILKDLVVELNEKCKYLSDKCETLEKEDKMARQCIKLNENTIYKLQRKIENLEERLEDFMEKQSEHTPKNEVIYWQSDICLKGVKNNTCSDTYNNLLVVWHQNGKQKSKWIRPESDKCTFRIAQDGIYKINCSAIYQRALQGQANQQAQNVLVMEDAINYNSNPYGFSSDRKMALVINNKKVLVKPLPESVNNSSRVMEFTAKLKVNSLIYVTILMGCEKSFTMSLSVEKVQ